MLVRWICSLNSFYCTLFLFLVLHFICCSDFCHGIMQIWTVKDGVCTHAFTNEKDGEYVMSVEFSPDKKQLIVGCVNGTVRVS